MTSPAVGAFIRSKRAQKQIPISTSNKI